VHIAKEITKERSTLLGRQPKGITASSQSYSYKQFLIETIFFKSQDFFRPSVSTQKTPQPKNSPEISLLKSEKITKPLQMWKEIN
jgi:hypothetical protein